MPVDKRCGEPDAPTDPEFVLLGAKSAVMTIDLLQLLFHLPSRNTIDS